MDLAEWYSAGRWVALLELIDMLPTACRLNEAIMNDPETAQELAALPDPDEPWSPRVSEYDLQARMNRQAVDHLAVISQLLLKSIGGKPTQPKPFPAPRTELDRAKEALEREFVEDMAGMFGFDAADL